jgi:predicted nucleotide-binding protein
MENKQATIIDEMTGFRTMLCGFAILRKKTIIERKNLTSEEYDTLSALFDEISIDAGKFGPLIKEITGLETIHTSAGPQDIWNWALSTQANILVTNALDNCISATSRTIGKLEEDIKKGLRDEQGNVIQKQQEISLEPAKAFIAHGGRSGVLDKLREFVEALGIKPIIVELSASKGMSVDDKVNKYIKDADCGIVLATRGGIIDKKSEKQHPRLNVIDEFERLRAVFPHKTILLLEKGVDLPSNISGLAHEPFARQSMDRAFIAIARELTEMNILKAIKPPKE